MPIAKGREAARGTGGNVFTAILEGVTNAYKERQIEDARREQENLEFIRNIKKLEHAEKLKQIMAQQEAEQKERQIVLEEEEKRKTKRIPTPFKISGTDVKEYEKATPIPWWEGLLPGPQSAAAKERVQFRQRFKQQFDQPQGGIPQIGITPPAAALPEGVTEDDIEYTMQKHGLTREEVLRRLSQ